MPKNLKIENWVKRISFTDDKLTIDGSVINDVEDVDILLDFIERLLKSENEKLLERIKLEKKDKAKFPLSTENRVITLHEQIGYNQAITDLETLKQQIKND